MCYIQMLISIFCSVSKQISDVPTLQFREQCHAHTRVFNTVLQFQLMLFLDFVMAAWHCCLCNKNHWHNFERSL